MNAHMCNERIIVMWAKFHSLTQSAVNFILIESEFNQNHKLFMSLSTAHAFTISRHYGTKNKDVKSTQRITYS